MPDLGVLYVDETGAIVSDREAEITPTAQSDVFRRIVSGEQNPATAFMTRKLKVDDNPMRASRSAKSSAARRDRVRSAGLRPSFKGRIRREKKASPKGSDMIYVKWSLWGVFWLILAGFLHYTLPQHDIVRITDTYEKRVDFGENALFWAQADTGNAGTPVSRDVFFIQTVRAGKGRVMVYRNEDTGWGWPPYFKFATANLQAEAADLKSTSEGPKWAIIKHYGWRNEFLSIYPNAISVRLVSGPDTRIIPWLNIVILTFLAALFWGVRARWKRFWSGRGAAADDKWSLR